jgi:predicted NUDIX family NTP pyrophosphohydrolase
MPKLSAGLLLYRRVDDSIEVLVAHPGGPIWARRDTGAWSIPKGAANDGEPLI